jgi:hypothetical protein
MKNEAFVYIWKNLTNGCQYIGYHKGVINDGYVSSSANERFWSDFKNSSNAWEREIVFFGSCHECLSKEQEILKSIDIKSDAYYNNARGASIIFTDEVVNKMKASHNKRWEKIGVEERKIIGEKISKSKMGTVKSQEERDRISKSLKGITRIEMFGPDRASEISKKISEKNTGSKRTEETKKKMSNAHSGEKNSMFGKKQSELAIEKQRERFLSDKNPGKNPSDETRKKMSVSRKGKPSGTKGIKHNLVICNHCGKEGGESIMKRWHFNNCKNK